MSRYLNYLGLISCNIGNIEAVLNNVAMGIACSGFESLIIFLFRFICRAICCMLEMTEPCTMSCNLIDSRLTHNCCNSRVACEIRLYVVHGSWLYRLSCHVTICIAFVCSHVMVHQCSIPLCTRGGFNGQDAALEFKCI